MKAKQNPLPTIPEIIQQLRGWGTDRAVMVREPRPDRKPGVMIVLLGDAALRDIGPWVIAKAKVIVDPARSGERIFIPNAAKVSEYFNELERIALPFTWTKEGNESVIVFCGDFVDDRFCAELTALGLPTSLK